MYEVKVPGGFLAADVTGPDDAPAMLLIHAGVVDRRMWDPIVPQLADRFRVIRYDLRGYGKSRVTEDASWSLHGDLLAVLGALEVNQAHVVGVSMGGTGALNAALAAPEKFLSLTLVGARPSGFDSPSEWTMDGWKRATVFYEAGDVENTLAVDYDMWIVGCRDAASVDPEYASWARGLVNDQGVHFSDPEGDEVELDPPANLLLELVSCPTLVVVGEFDAPEFIPLGQEMAERIPDARFVTIADSAHLPPAEQPQQFLESLTAFIDEIDRL